MPRSLIVGNWKMQLSLEESRALASAIVAHCTDLRTTDVWIAPSFTALPAVTEICRNSLVRVGAQNVHWELSGAYTGEISPKMLRELGCTFAIVGHSERRNSCNETIEICSRRALGALEHGLDLIFCIGEFAAERQSKRTQEILAAQLAPFLTALKPEHRRRCTIAYEPVWAIGSGISGSRSEIVETTRLIQQTCSDFLGGEPLPVLYGGSVTPKNFDAVINESSVTGALIGSASLSATDFIQVITMSESFNGTTHRT